MHGLTTPSDTDTHRKSVPCTRKYTCTRELSKFRLKRTTSYSDKPSYRIILITDTTRTPSLTIIDSESYFGAGHGHGTGLGILFRSRSRKLTLIWRRNRTRKSDTLGHHSGTILLPEVKVAGCGMRGSATRIPQLRCLRNVETQVAESSEIALLGFHRKFHVDVRLVAGNGQDIEISVSKCQGCQLQQAKPPI